jgi:choice-of-anchor B domain-containing protein
MRYKLIFLITISPMFIFSQSGWNMNLLGSFDYETNHNTKCNDIWGWEDGNGNEYALVGLENGFSCVDVTNPSSPAEMFFISDINSTWRDIKSWGNYAYITTEANAGLLIVDLSDMTGNTYWHVTQFNNPNTGNTINFTSAHNLYIDENGIAYIFGAKNNGSYVANRGAIFLDVNANATNPEYLGEWDDYYIHDGMTRGDTMYVGCIYEGELFVVDVSNKSNPQTLGSQTTPNSFTHNAWVSDDGNYVFTTDEQSDAYLAAYDISSINNIQEVDRIQSNPGSNSIPHNTHVDGNFLITSYYRDGTTVHDITYPNHMIQVAYYDSYAGIGNGFNGCWGTYPFLTSGNIISSDRDSQNGKGVLNIYGRAFQQACYLSGNIIDGINGNNIASADVTILSTTTSTQTNIVGDYQTAIVDSGTYQVVFSTIGYMSDTLSILLDNGIMTVLDAQLYPIGSGCTDSLACNYNLLATINDGSCVYPNTSISTIDTCTDTGFIWNGITYTASGSYTYSTINTNGCDSTVTLNLTINASTTSTTIHISCDSYTWNGATYTVSGAYTYSTTNTNGCDSTAALDLTINPSTTSTTTHTSCDSYTWNGATYTASGAYTYSITNTNGCDSTAALNLTINPSTTSTTTHTSCDSYTWNGTTYTASGSYTYSTTNANGCDSTATLNLTINNTTILQQTYSICDGDSVQVGWSAYHTSGTYIDTISGQWSGLCDSIIYTTIIVDHNTSSYDTLLVNVSIVWNGMNLIVSGDYSIILLNSAGCDSITNLNLTILHSGIQDLSEDRNKTVLRIINVLGEPTKPTSNVPLFYIYDDGTVKKRVVIE